MLLPNGDIAYNKYTCQLFLSSLGMDEIDIENFINFFLSDTIDWKQESKEWELDSMHQFEKRNGLINDLQEVIDDLRAGKGTKRQIAERINNLCEYWY